MNTLYLIFGRVYPDDFPVTYPTYVKSECIPNAHQEKWVYPGYTKKHG